MRLRERNVAVERNRLDHSLPNYLAAFLGDGVKPGLARFCVHFFVSVSRASQDGAGAECFRFILHTLVISLVRGKEPLGGRDGLFFWDVFLTVGSVESSRPLIKTAYRWQALCCVSLGLGGIIA